MKLNLNIRSLRRDLYTSHQSRSVDGTEIYKRMIPIFLSLILSLLFTSSASTAQKSPLQIITVSSDAFTARFTLPELKITDTPDGTAITFEGADRTLEPGKPNLPLFTQCIGIPIIGNPILNILRTHVETKTVAQVVYNPKTEQPHSPTGNTKTLHNFYPQHVVEVIPSGFVREQRIGSLQINPIQYNPTTRQLKIYATVEFRILFPAAGNAAPAAPSLIPTEAPYYENLFQGMLLNYAQARPWRKQRRTHIAAAYQAPAAPQATHTHRFKIPITKTDLYRITYNNLKAAGVTPETINLDSIRLENAGQKHGIYIFDHNENEIFDNGEWIIFYGRALVDNKFTNENVYWLYFNITPMPAEYDASRVQTRDATPRIPNLIAPSAFLARARFEEDVHHDALTGSDIKSELADHYFWIAFRGGNLENARKDLPVTLPGAAPRLQINRNATLRIKFQGASRRGIALHRAQISFNGQRLGRIEEWKRQASQIATRTIQQRLIHPNEGNWMRIDALDTNKTAPGQYDFYLDWYEFDYWHDFNAQNNRLEFNSTTEPRTLGNVQYRITNFFDETIDVYKLGDRGITQRLIGGKITPTGATHHILFQDHITQHSRYFVIGRDAYRSINALIPTPTTTLRNPANQADYLVITHPTFKQSIQPLVEFRRSQGLTTSVVDITDIYDEFSDGLFNPFAIQKFLRYAYTSWKPPAPTYVVLVGDAHYDYKNATVERYRRDASFHGTYALYPIFVPTFHGWAPESGETAMDGRFVNVSGEDALPDMFIGRLSVQNSQELNVMVKKIINYERKLKTGPWQGTLIQVADDHLDNPGDALFEISRNELIRDVIPPGYNTRQIYLRQVKSPTLTASRIRSALNDGALAIEYTGHGGIQTWADESIFRSEDVTQLRNRYLPFVITTTCLNGQFDKPQQIGNFCLSEQFLLGQYGAIAALSATRLTYGTANAEFDRDLFKSLFEPALKQEGDKRNGVSLGKIIADAKIKFLTRIRNPQWIPGTEQYTLFGDPATRLARPELDIKVELERIALNDKQQLVILQNEVGRTTQNGTWQKANDFNSEILSATAFFPNNFDDDLGNELSRRTLSRVWQGEYGTIRLHIPNTALPGSGVVRLFAFNDAHAAVGGQRFWIETPVIREIKEELDIIKDTLQLNILIVDDKGAAGLRNLSVLWDNTAEFEDATIPLVEAKTPFGETPPGGQWYQLQTPIPLPQGGRQVRYRIQITDTTGHEIAHPSKTDRNIVKVPEGPNIAIGTDGTNTAPIRYQFSEAENRYQLVAELINNGGRFVQTEFEVVFAEGNPDANGDSRIDDEADILAAATITANDWKQGTHVLQHATATVSLNTPLTPGVHKIYALADPDDPEIDDKILGNIHEARIFDNKKYFSFVVNDFNYKPNEKITAFSLDRVFDIHFPAGAIDTQSNSIPLSVSSYPPEDGKQPDIYFAPIPRVAALRRGLIRQADEAGSARHYEAAFRTGVTQLKKPAQVKIRFDVSAIEDIVRNSQNPLSQRDSLYQSLPTDAPAFKAAVAETADQLAIYTWQAQHAAWRRLTSEIKYTEATTEPEFALENYVTPTQIENASQQELMPDNININPNLTPAGNWVILFLDASQYQVFLRRKGETPIQELDTTGHLDIPFRVEAFGLELLIPSQESTPLGKKFSFEFADILTFNTDYNPQGDVVLVNTRNKNRGNGTATVHSRLGPKKEFEVGDWFIFLTSTERYEIRDTAALPVHLPNGVKVTGIVNETLFLSHLGLEILVSASSEDFEFGDKIKFSSARVGTITAEVTELTPFTLMHTTDNEPPSFQIWVDGIQPQTGSVIPPRPTFSILFEDENGIDIDTLSFAKRKDGGPTQKLTEGGPDGYQRRTESGIYTLPIDYQPILFPGEHTFEFQVQDFNANPIGGEDRNITYRFFVTEEPDITPPEILVRVLANDSPTAGGSATHRSETTDIEITDGIILTQQPQFEITLTDDGALDNTSFNLALNQTYEPLTPLDENAYTFRFDAQVPTTAAVTFAPDLHNGDYQLQVAAADTSQNAAELQIAFSLNQAVSLDEVFNVPNPTPNGKTTFTYHLAQPPDEVTIKIYTVTGRLIRTILDASARRGNNETEWDGRDETGTRCANGVYLYRVIAHTDSDTVEQVGKLAILR